MDLKTATCMVEPFSVAGADVVVTGFGAEDVAASLDEQLRKRLTRQSVTLLAPGDALPPGAFVIRGRFVRIDQGNRWLRYFLTLLAGKALVDVEAEILRDGQKLEEVFLQKRQAIGVLGGENKAMTQQCAKCAADDLARKLATLAKKL